MNWQRSANGGRHRDQRVQLCLGFVISVHAGQRESRLQNPFPSTLHKGDGHQALTSAPMVMTLSLGTTRSYR